MGKSKGKIAKRLLLGNAVGKKREQEWKSDGRDREENVRKFEGVMVRKLRLGEELWRVIGVYVNKDLATKFQFIREWMEDKEEEVRVVIGGILT